MEVSHVCTRRGFPRRPPGLYERNRYSPAVRSDGLLFVSGQVGSRDDGSPERVGDPGPPRLRQSECGARRGRLRFDDVLDVTVFMVDAAERLEDLGERRTR